MAQVKDIWEFIRYLKKLGYDPADPAQRRFSKIELNPRRRR